ncbi:MAG: hypothetical protein LBD06_06120, partial [Candidatus Accumulibacter sp.]|nr:hypothetical protein [Accumulibacter sp.]
EAPQTYLSSAFSNLCPLNPMSAAYNPEIRTLLTTRKNLILISSVWSIAHIGFFLVSVASVVMNRFFRTIITFSHNR